MLATAKINTAINLNFHRPDNTTESPVVSHLNLFPCLIEVIR